MTNIKFKELTIRPKNKPVKVLIDWLTDKKSGHVGEARREIRRRFEYLDNRTG